jgi:hypothetical protein
MSLLAMVVLIAGVVQLSSGRRQTGFEGVALGLVVLVFTEWTLWRRRRN